MITDILTNTPVWVWAVLALLIFRGWSASRTREGPMLSFFILPVVMMLIGLQGMGARYGVEVMPWIAYVVGFCVCAAIGWMTIHPSHVTATATGVRLAGSYWPLAIIIAVFVLRYSSEVVRAMNPAVLEEPLIKALLAGSYGLVTGMFIGRLSKIVATYRSLRRQIPVQATA